MIPSVISPEVKSSAERKIFEWFQNAPGTDKWIVLHSLGITTHNKVTQTSHPVLASKSALSPSKSRNFATSAGKSAKNSTMRA